MAGIYIHIPFCRQACSYCNFHFSTTAKNKAELIEAIQRELISRKSYLESDSIQTIYFGGGTPSILSGSEMQKIFDTLSSNYDLSELKEVTLEANPDDLSLSKIKEISTLPINRLSIGVQSFHESDLQFMNRAHSSKEAFNAIKRSQDAGLCNISIDLIYGTPGSDLKKWEQNLSAFFSLNIPHLSSYALTVEEKTSYAHQIAKGKIQAPQEDDLAEQYNLLQDFIKEHNWLHYELSNYASEGMQAIHNSSYWQGDKYMGIGPSAHSYNGISRQWNIANNQLYSKFNFDESDYFELEILSEKEKYHDALISRLRTLKGISKEYLENDFTLAVQAHFLKEVKHLSPYMDITVNSYRIKDEFWLTSDEIVQKLMLDE